MGKRGVKAKGKVKIRWSPDFAYGLGLLVTDGCLYRRGTYVNFTSKDKELIEHFLKAFSLSCRVGKKSSRSKQEKKYFFVQFGDIRFGAFLQGIGITENKTKTIGELAIPEKYFFDFLRGHLDGDGCTYSYFDPRWRSSFMFYTVFVSASKEHIEWLRSLIFKKLGIKGHVTKNGNGAVHQLKYAKKESLKILKKMYYSDDVLCLSRKREKIREMFVTAGLDKYMPRWRNW